MNIPVKVWITLAIIIVIGIGTGALVFGIMFQSVQSSRQEFAVTWIATGAALLGSGMSALIAHLAGGFRGIDDGHQ